MPSQNTQSRPRGRSAAVTATAALALTALWLVIFVGPAYGDQPPHFVGASTDGSKAFFETTDSIVASDTDSSQDVYERSGGTTTLVSTGPTGGNGAFGAFFVGASPDGTKVFFGTSEQLVAADTDTSLDVYERSGGTTTLISTGPDGGNGAFAAFFDGASTDGTKVFFHTNESLISDDSDSSQDVYQRSGGTTTLISSQTGLDGGNGGFGAFFEGASADGTKVFFDTDESLIAASDTDATKDIYQRSGGTTTLVSTGPDGGNGAFNAAFRGASADGTKVFFETSESLVSPGDSDTSQDIYERSSGTTTTLISTGPDGGNGAFGTDFNAVSTDGTKVLFGTDESLVAATDTDSDFDLYERSGTTTTQLSQGAINGNLAFGAGFDYSSGDAARVFFDTNEPLVSADTDSSSDIYQRSSGTTTLVTQGSINGNGAFDAGLDGISADGTKAVFDTNEPLVAADTDSSDDVYDRSGNTTTLVSDGPLRGSGDVNPGFPSNSPNVVSSDGSHVFFEPVKSLVTADTDTNTDVYDHTGGTTMLVSVDPPPETTIDSGPSGPTNNSTPTFTFHSSEPNSLIDCMFDAELTPSCGSPLFPSSPLADGPHTFQAVATDSGGNTDPVPATRSFTVDTKPPNTTITSGPSDPTRDRTPTFRFRSGQAGSTFRCKRDAKPFSKCRSPKTFGTLSFGRHVFKVKARDPAGNVDLTPAKQVFHVIR
jgi:hypothetical protein